MATIYTRKDFLDYDSEEAGIKWHQFTSALSIWLWLRQKPTTCAEAAAELNCDEEVIWQAVDSHPYLYISDLETGLIDHDGE